VVGGPRYCSWQDNVRPSISNTNVECEEEDEKKRIEKFTFLMMMKIDEEKMRSQLIEYQYSDHLRD
jgi:hypothetical protein